MDLRDKFKIFICTSLAAIAVLASYNLLRDIFSGEKARVHKFILKGKKAVEARNIFACRLLVSGKYKDKYGNDYSALIYAAQGFFKYYQVLLVNIENMEIKFQDSKENAEVEITALVIGKTNQNTQERFFEGERGRFRVRLIKEDKRWQLVELEFLEPLTIMEQNIS